MFKTRGEIMSTVDKCKELGQPIIEEMGYFLVDVEFVKEGKNFILRYLVDSSNGIDIDECALISEKISTVLDKEDPITQEYMLEIASPGAERTLKTIEDVTKSIGKYVNIKLYAPLNNLKEYEGDLISFENDILTIQYNDKTTIKTVEIKYDLISKIRLAIKF
ncbi:MAG: ribosome maturation factor RimP [Haloplasmataceae bacterium]|jgi:ribosome maturation factor RimP|nr:ribosome maturation factor RimP [Haloplasmataceae bacterium]